MIIPAKPVEISFYKPPPNRNMPKKIANKFKDEVLKKYKDVTKAVVIFGSFTRSDFHKGSDIDMLVVIDDTLSRFTPEMKMRFDDDIYAIGKKLSDAIVVQPAWTLTEFWRSEERRG